MGLGPNAAQNSSCSLDSDDDDNHMSDDSSLKPDVINNTTPKDDYSLKPDVTDNTTPKDESSLKPNVTDKNTSRTYEGRLNIETVKGVSFLGPNCEYETSGSDCGRIFIWRKKDEQLVRVMEADKYVVNCVVSHPHIMVLASSGIDKDVKIWHPEAIERAALPVRVGESTKHLPMNFFGSHDAVFFDLYTDETDDDDVDDSGDEEDDCDDNNYSSGVSMDEDEDDEDNDSDEELDLSRMNLAAPKTVTMMMLSAMTLMMTILQPMNTVLATKWYCSSQEASNNRCCHIMFARCILHSSYTSSEALKLKRVSVELPMFLRQYLDSSEQLYMANCSLPSFIFILRLTLLLPSGRASFFTCLSLTFHGSVEMESVLG